MLQKYILTICLMIGITINLTSIISCCRGEHDPISPRDTLYVFNKSSQQIEIQIKKSIWHKNNDTLDTCIVLKQDKYYKTYLSHNLPDNFYGAISYEIRTDKYRFYKEENESIDSNIINYLEYGGILWTNVNIHKFRYEIIFTDSYLDTLWQNMRDRKLDPEIKK